MNWVFLVAQSVSQLKGSLKLPAQDKDYVIERAFK